MINTYTFLKDHKRISIIGMEKNVGKTTLLNQLILDIADQKTLALTSIGRDGEEVDVVTSTHKPKIFVYPGTIVATARDCLANCDITKEILYTTNFTTPMGNIVVVRAITGGYVDIAGPSYNKQIKEILNIMESFGAEISIVDGALGRKSSAIGEVTDATVLATGAAFSLDMSKVIEETKKTTILLNLPEFSGEKKEIESWMSKARVVIQQKDGTVIFLKAISTMDSVQEIKEYLKKDLENVFVRGAVTSRFLDVFIKNRGNFDHVNLVAIDGTRFFISYQEYQKALACNLSFYVMNTIHLLFVSCNPHSPLGVDFPKKEFQNKLQQEILCHVIDVKEGEKCDLSMKEVSKESVLTDSCHV
ncbi:hypothetical protein A2U10_01530 [Fusobacterium necrophorum subsp. funduliforme]|uniref:Uncharacterized protein n=2 Tax=Fusobacterium necrophorum TaxID=859 RepID=A0AAN3VUY7_9FUSO|nr:hypothetical protein [Fusobacterium necrophorum]AVQ21157.1 hypothetical protein C4N15_05690 [Fusobacterium necrophorum subsp. funduliforme]AYV94981.1 hypothetical protein BWX37_04830 [Fusobacterium necrophorum subsp. funduliforme]EFS23493.2 hypothetical protein FSEG_01100 [Fusobacterium necrophorum D12]EJU16255.1 hypothetical protein HMPREF1127_0959 [Fusobacterium necrophorum subsp. funduliforme Fnf 1007]KYK99933.1 hypothetical protein A2J05_07110 [Fusobacterium necrophorum subsp. fundulifo